MTLSLDYNHVRNIAYAVSCIDAYSKIGTPMEGRGGTPLRQRTSCNSKTNDDDVSWIVAQRVERLIRCLHAQNVNVDATTVIVSNDEKKEEGEGGRGKKEDAPIHENRNKTSRKDQKDEKNEKNEKEEKEEKEGKDEEDGERVVLEQRCFLPRPSFSAPPAGLRRVPKRVNLCDLSREENVSE